MSDLFGFSQPRAEFVDIGTQRPSVAEQKAILCKRLGELLRAPPPVPSVSGNKRYSRMVIAARKREKNTQQGTVKRQRIAVCNQSNE